MSGDDRGREPILSNVEGQEDDLHHQNEDLDTIDGENLLAIEYLVLRRV